MDHPHWIFFQILPPDLDVIVWNPLRVQTLAPDQWSKARWAMKHRFMMKINKHFLFAFNFMIIIIFR